MNIDPEILLGLQNSKQNQSSLELQREILAMQKLQVLNQVRISQGLPPLAKLPEPPPEPPPEPERSFVAWILLFGVVGFLMLLALVALGKIFNW